MKTFDSRLFGYRVTTSLYGGPIPLLYGTQRVAGSVLWTGNFTATPVSGGKKSGKKGSQQQFDYKSSIIIGLCQGVVDRINFIWVNQIRYVVNSATQTATIPGGGSPIVVANAANFLADQGVGNQQAYNLTANNYGSPGPVTLVGTSNQVLELVTGTPGPGQYTVNPATGAYTFASADAGQVVQISYTFVDPNTSWDGNPTANLGFTLFTGTQGQAPWGTLPGGQALGYSELAYLVNPLLDMGTTGNIDNFSFEVTGPGTIGGGIDDADLSIIIPDFLSNTLHGAGFPAANIGDLAMEIGPQGTGGQMGGSGLEYYCTANGIFVSPLITEQRSAASALQDWLSIANCEAVWSEGILKFYCYGDKTVVGGNLVYIPNTTPVYDFTDDDYLSDIGEAPVSVDRPNVRDCYNAVKVEWTNRENNYQSETVEEMDLWHISQYGYRPAPVIKAEAVTTQVVAAQIANVALKNLVYKRNTYKFKVSAVKNQLLEPMDLVTLTDVYLGLNQTPVRITSITEDEDLRYDIEAEEFPWGTQTPTLYPKQTVGPFGPGYFAPPGSVYAPTFFEATREMTQNVGYQLRIGLTGGNQWGGCMVHVSTDGGLTYAPIGRQQGSSRMGVLTGALPYALDPDTTNTLSVDMTESNGQTLESFTKAQADAYLSLFVIDQELMSYENSALASQNVYHLTYLRRGVYDSAQSAHKSGATLLMLDSTAFTWEYTEDLIGKTLYFKFTSFNLSNNAEENIANVAAYPYYIHGPRLPYPARPNQYQTRNYPGAPFNTLLQYSFDQQLTYNNSGTSGQVQAKLALRVSLPINTASQATQAPVISITGTPSTGGSLAGGSYLNVAAYAVDSGANTTLLNIRSVQIPVGTNTNRITGTYVLNNVSDVLVLVVAGDPANGWTPCVYTTSGGTFSITAIPTGPIYDPSICDPIIDHLVVRVTQGSNSGVYGATVASPVTGSGTNTGGSSVITFADPYNGIPHFAANCLVGRYFSLLSTADQTRWIPLTDLLITANTACTTGSGFTITVDGNVTVGANAPYIDTGDTVFVRLQATNYGPSLIGDSLQATYNPLVPHVEKGNVVRIIGGTGAGTENIIADNDTGANITMLETWAITPDSTSVYIILRPNTVQDLPLTTYSQLAGTNFPTFASISLALPNDPNTYWIVQVLTADVAGETSAESYGPYRELWLPGSGLPIANITFADSPFSLGLQNTVLYVDTTGGNVVVNLPPSATNPGRDFVIVKITSDANTVTVQAAAGETISGGLASLTITTAWVPLQIISSGVV